MEGEVLVDGRDFVTAVAARRAITSRMPRLAAQPVLGLRFAFYGRMSTDGFQDAATSKAWQRAVCDELVEGFGAVVVEFLR